MNVHAGDLDSQSDNNHNQESKWVKIKRERARVHRKNCVLAANNALSNLKKLGVEAVIFGSITKDFEKFTDKSDIDFCIINQNGIDESDLELIIRLHTKNIDVDICLFEQLKLGVKKSVISEGVKNVE